MTLIGIRNGLIATVVAQGKWAASEISSCDFGIATLCASCVVLQPGPGTVITPTAIGTAACGGTTRKTKEWDITGMVLVKDPGDATTFLGELWTACDDIFTSIDADTTLDNSCDESYLSTISRPSLDAFIEGEGTDFGFITFNVRATEYT